MLTIEEILFLVSKGLNNTRFIPVEPGCRVLHIKHNKLYSIQTGFDDTEIKDNKDCLLGAEWMLDNDVYA